MKKNYLFILYNTHSTTLMLNDSFSKDNTKQYNELIKNKYKYTLKQILINYLHSHNIHDIKYLKTVL